MFAILTTYYDDCYNDDNGENETDDGAAGTVDGRARVEDGWG